MTIKKKAGEEKNINKNNKKEAKCICQQILCIQCINNGRDVHLKGSVILTRIYIF